MEAIRVRLYDLIFSAREHSVTHR